MQVEIESKELVIRLPLEEPRLSATGKTIIRASSHGNHRSEAMIDGQPVYIGCNCYTYPPKPAKGGEIIRAEVVE